jgi:hypothetical protein
MFDVLHAQVLGSGLASADLVVQYTASTDTTAPRTAYLSTPYPVFHGKPGAFAVSFANGAEDTTVERVDLEVPGGYDFTHNGGMGAQLFAPGAPMNLDGTGDGAWEWIDAKHVAWTGSRDVASGTATSWRVGINITSDESVTTAIDETFRSLPEVNASFANGFSMRSARWGSVPGLIHLDVPNATIQGAPPAEQHDGYPSLGLQHSNFTTRSTAFGTATGTASYNVTPAASHLVDLDTSIASSSFHVANRSVRLGSTVTTTGDLQSVMGEVAKNSPTNENLTVDLYSPASLGCHPTASWTWAAGALPLSRITAATVWHSAPDALLLGTSDMHVHLIRVAAGVPVTVWSQAVSAAPSQLVVANVGGLAKVFVGGAGMVTRIDLATGNVDWTTLTDPNLLKLSYNAPSDSLFVVTSQHVERRDLASGGVTRAIASGAADAFRDAIESPNGGLYVASTLHVSRFDASWTQDASLPLGGGALSSGPGGVLAEIEGGGAASVERIDPLTWQATPITTLSAVPQRIVSGDATGDASPDLVLAEEGPIITVVNGATLVAWTYSPPVGTLYYGQPFSSYDPQHQQLPQQGCSNELELESIGAGYDNDPDCKMGDAGTVAFTVNALAAANGYIEYSFAGDAGTGAVDLLDASGTKVWRRTGSQPSLPSVLILDTWNGEIAGGYGTEDGRAYLYRTAGDNQQVLQASPAGSVGKFSFSFPIPLGALFGTHLIVSTLSWDQTDPTSHATVHQAARLADWFEVVDVDGTPVEFPTYRVVAVLQDRAEPKHESCYQTASCADANEH